MLTACLTFQKTLFIVSNVRSRRSADHFKTSDWTGEVWGRTGVWFSKQTHSNRDKEFLESLVPDIPICLSQNRFIPIS